MGAPPPAFTIRHLESGQSDNVTPFRDYDNMGLGTGVWDPVHIFKTKQIYFEEWTTNELITFKQYEEYGEYYVGERSDMYAVNHFVYDVPGQYMPVFRKIDEHDLFSTSTDDCRWIMMRNMPNKDYRSGICAFPTAVCLKNQVQPPNPNPNPIPQDDDHQQPKRLADPTEIIEEEEEEDDCHWVDEIIEDYFSDRGSSTESPYNK